MSRNEPMRKVVHEMLKRNLWDFEVKIDEAATAEWYTTREPWGCECGHCRNFLKLARDNELPDPVHAILKELNISAENATYVCEIIPKDGGHLYQFSYRIAGRILNEDTAKSTVAEWGEVRCCHEIYPYGAPGFPTPHFDLEFWVTLPWVLDSKDLEKALTELVMDLKPAPEVPADTTPFESIDFDRSEKDNAKWVELITGYLNTAKTFEIHCWNEETEWIKLALQYGELKDDDWKYGKIITGKVTPQFIDMLLGQAKPLDTEIYNKMTPFFNVFLDDNFQSGHYGTENYYK